MNLLHSISQHKTIIIHIQEKSLQYFLESNWVETVKYGVPLFIAAVNIYFVYFCFDEYAMLKNYFT